MNSAIGQFLGKIKGKGKKLAYVCHNQTATCDKCKAGNCHQIYNGTMLRTTNRIGLNSEDVMEILSDNARIVVFCETGRRMTETRLNRVPRYQIYQRTVRCFTNLRTGELFIEHLSGDVTDCNSDTMDDFSKSVKDSMEKFLIPKYEKYKFVNRGKIKGRNYGV